MQAWLMGAILLVIGAIVLALLGLLAMWREPFGRRGKLYAQRLEALGRGKALAEPDQSILKPRTQEALTQLARAGMLADLAWSLRRAGLNWSLQRLGLYALASALLGGGLAKLAGLPAGLVLALLGAGALVPFALVRHRCRMRIQQLERQLPDVLDMMGGMLRAGHTLPATLALLSEHIPDPLGEEFRLLHSELTYGGSADDAMHHLIERTRNETIRSFVMAVLVQRETGGHLSDVLAGLSQVVRERLKLEGKIRALSAEGRLSAVVLTALPGVVGGAIQLINPGYLNVFWVDETGIMMLYGMLAMLLLGNVWMRKLIRIRV
jgi:tight adherence protein B